MEVNCTGKHALKPHRWTDQVETTPADPGSERGRGCKPSNGLGFDGGGSITLQRIQGLLRRGLAHRPLGLGFGSGGVGSHSNGSRVCGGGVCTTLQRVQVGGVEGPGSLSSGPRALNLWEPLQVAQRSHPGLLLFETCRGFG